MVYQKIKFFFFDNGKIQLGGSFFLSWMGNSPVEGTILHLPPSKDNLPSSPLSRDSITRMRLTQLKEELDTKLGNCQKKFPN